MSETVEEMLQMLKDYLVLDFKEAFREIQFRDEKNLIQVMKDVFSHTRCPFVILIDEWDCLFREYKQNKEAQIWISFCIEYVYRIFNDKSKRNGRIFWLYRSRS